MEKAEFKLGDTAWFYAGNRPGNPITDGKIIHIFEHYFEKLYVIEEKSSIEPNYYVRHSEEMSDSKDKPINLYRESLEQLRKSLEKTLEETQNKLKEIDNKKITKRKKGIK